MDLDQFPRYPLTFGPSPVHPLERLTKHLGGAAVWAKRDDVSSGLAFGGNKTRKSMAGLIDVHEVGPGGSAFVGGGVPHTFANPTADAARFLVVCAPGGFEDYLRALAAGDQAGVAAASTRAGYAPQPGG